MEKTYVFHVSGMHCKACVLLTDSELADVPSVRSAKTDLETATVEVVGDFGGRAPAQVAEELSVPLKKHGYALTLDKPIRQKPWEEFRIAAPVAVAIVAGFLLLQRAGLVNLIDGGEVTYGTAFVIGVVASLSTCLAVVGGLVLSMSAVFAKNGQRTRPQMLFHAGRLASFFVLGGVIGAAGSSLQVRSDVSAWLGFAVGCVMLVLGLNLLDVFDWARRLQPSMPKSVSSRAMGVTGLRSALAPLLVGAVTFFLPCGFTQSMQLYALTTGGFVSGALTMSAFALGTLPVLALLSFGSKAAAVGRHRGTFFKAVGLVVMAFALFNMHNSLVAAGFIRPLIRF